MSIRDEELARFLYHAWASKMDKWFPLHDDETDQELRSKPRPKWVALNSLEQQVWIDIASQSKMNVEYELGAIKPVETIK